MHDITPTVFSKRNNSTRPDSHRLYANLVYTRINNHVLQFVHPSVSIPRKPVFWFEPHCSSTRYRALLQRGEEIKQAPPKFVHSLICLRRNGETRITHSQKLLNTSFHMQGPPAQCRVATMHGHRTMMMMVMMTMVIVTTCMTKETIMTQTVAMIMKGENNQFTTCLVQFQFKNICKP